MASLLRKTSIASAFRSHSQVSENAAALFRRRFHIEPGPREKALLEADPALKRFKSHKKDVWRLKRLGDVLTVLVVSGCGYEIYVKAVMKQEARKQADAAS